MKSLASRGWGALLAVALVSASIGAACGSSGDDGYGSNFGDDGGALGDGTLPTDDAPTLAHNDGGLGADANSLLVITPQSPVLAVTTGTAAPIATQKFTATFAGTPITAAWSIDRGEVGAIDGTGLLTPTGLVGGKATITATYQGAHSTTDVTVSITEIGVGDPNPPDAGGGAGGFGGVGGDGEGAGATSGQQTTLNGTATADAAVKFLYPYDGTVWPRGLLPPLLQWSTGAHNFDAVYIHLKEASYEYKGYFQKPAAAATFKNHPVPRSAWDHLGYSNAGEDVTVTLVFSEGGSAVGPVTAKWKIAQGTLKGTIYYNSYGTNLAQNLCCTAGTSNKFGGATLAIREGATDPVLVAGGSSADQSGCRVCHSVSANGSTLLTEHGDAYGTTSAYALTNNNLETTIANNNGNGRFTYPAIFPDGTKIFTGESALYNLDGTSIATTGLPAGRAGYLPAFSPDGTHVAYNFGGTGGDNASIYEIDFTPSSNTFANERKLYSPPSGTHAYWPSFLPTNDGVVFEVETVSNGRDTAGTRSQCDQGGGAACQNEGTHAELWWASTTSNPPKAARLDTLNGTLNGARYITDHPTYTGSNGDDTTLNYEPTVNPVPSGGYAWVVFTSRRVYGNVATINPYWSDPRFQDISATPTTKKLWVAAIDLNAPAGSDPSHPAFYLPAQELFAGNARGFWVVDPCHVGGTSCVTGDECCGGYCQPGDGGLVCTDVKPACSGEFEKCTTTQDCCAGTNLTCINGRCATPGPK